MLGREKNVKNAAREATVRVSNVDCWVTGMRVKVRSEDETVHRTCRAPHVAVQHSHTLRLSARSHDVLEQKPGQTLTANAAS